MAGSVKIDIPFHAETKDLIKEVEKAFDRVEGMASDIQISKGLRKDMDQVKRMISELGAAFEKNLKPGKIDSKGIDKFKKEVADKVGDIERRVSTLEGSFGDFQKEIDNFSATKMGKEISNLKEDLGGLAAEMKEVASAFEAIQKGAAMRGQTMELVDSSQLKTLEGVLETIDKIKKESKGLEDIYSIASVKDSKTATKDIQRAYKDARNLVVSLKDVDVKSEEGTKQIGNLGKALKEFFSLANGKDVSIFDGINFKTGADKKNKDFYNAFNDMEQIADAYVSYLGNVRKEIQNEIEKIETVSLDTSKINKNTNSGGNNAINIPIKISTTRKGLRSEAVKIIDGVSNDLAKHPIEVNFALVSKYKQQKRKDVLERLSEQIDNIADKDTKQKLAQLMADVEKQFSQDIELKISSNIDATVDAVKDGLNEIQSAMDKAKFYVRPNIEITPEEIENVEKTWAELVKKYPLNLQQGANAEEAVDQVESKIDKVSGEKGSFTKLKNFIENDLIPVIKDKTSAFEDEAIMVGRVVDKEISELSILKQWLEDIQKGAIDIGKAVDTWPEMKVALDDEGIKAMGQLFGNLFTLKMDDATEETINEQLAKITRNLEVVLSVAPIETWGEAFISTLQKVSENITALGIDSVLPVLINDGKAKKGTKSTKSTKGGNVADLADSLSTLPEVLKPLQNLDGLKIDFGDSDIQKVLETFEQLSEVVTSMEKHFSDLSEMMKNSFGAMTNKDLTDEFNRIKKSVRDTAKETKNWNFSMSSTKESFSGLVERFNAYKANGGKREFNEIFGKKANYADKLINKYKEEQEAAKKSVIAVSKENDEAKETADVMDLAAQAKERFAKANAKVEGSAKESASAINIEADALIDFVKEIRGGQNQDDKMNGFIQLTDKNGNPLTVYRGVNNAYGAFDSNRYHGGTFATTSLKLSRNYLEGLTNANDDVAGKIYKYGILANKILEIYGNNNAWRDILYLGNGQDKDSKDIKEAYDILEENGYSDFIKRTIELGQDIKQVENLISSYFHVDDAPALTRFGTMDLPEKMEELFREDFGYNSGYKLNKNIREEIFHIMEPVEANFLMNRADDIANELSGIDNEFNKGVLTKEGRATRIKWLVENRIPEAIRDVDKTLTDDIVSFLSSLKDSGTYAFDTKKTNELDGRISKAAKELQTSISNWIIDHEEDIKAEILNKQQRVLNAAKTFRRISDDKKSPYGYGTTNDFSEKAFDSGYDTVIFRDIYDGANFPTDVFVTKYKEQLKDLQTIPQELLKRIDLEDTISKIKQGYLGSDDLGESDIVDGIHSLISTYIELRESLNEQDKEITERIKSVLPDVENYTTPLNSINDKEMEDLLEIVSLLKTIQHGAMNTSTYREVAQNMLDDPGYVRDLFSGNQKRDLEKSGLLDFDLIDEYVDEEKRKVTDLLNQLDINKGFLWDGYGDEFESEMGKIESALEKVRLYQSTFERMESVDIDDIMRTSSSISSIEKESDAAEDLKTDMSDAAEAKRAFTEANQKLQSQAEESVGGIEKEDKAIDGISETGANLDKFAEALSHLVSDVQNMETVIALLKELKSTFTAFGGEKAADKIDKFATNFERFADAINSIKIENISSLNMLKDILGDADALKSFSDAMTAINKAGGVPPIKTGSPKINLAQDLIRDRESDIESSVHGYFTDKGADLLNMELKALKNGLVEVKALIHDVDGANKEYIFHTADGIHLQEESVKVNTTGIAKQIALYQKLADAYKKAHQGDATPDGSAIDQQQQFAHFLQQDEELWQSIVDYVSEYQDILGDIKEIVFKSDVHGKNTHDYFNITGTTGNRITIGKSYDEINTAQQSNLLTANIDEMLADATDKLDKYTLNRKNYKYLQEFDDEVQRLKEHIAELEKYSSKALGHNKILDGDQVKNVQALNEALQASVKNLKDMSGNTRFISGVDSAEKNLEKLYKTMNQYSSMPREMMREFEVLGDELKYAINTDASEAEVKQLEAELDELKRKLAEAGVSGKNMIDTIKNSFKSKVAQQIAIYFSLNDFIRYARTAFNTVRELDTALVDLRKTTTMSANDLNQFYLDANESAKKLGVSTQEVIQQAADWSRLGFSDKNSATKMAELSSQFAAISPGMDVQQSVDGLVSTMKAFGVEVDDVKDKIMSNINIIGKLLPKRMVTYGIAIAI